MHQNVKFNMETPSLLDTDVHKTPMPTPIWTPSHKQVHRPMAICHQDSLWGDTDSFKTTFTGFSISNLCWYDLQSQEQNAVRAQCQDSWPPVQIFRLLSKVTTCFETEGMFNIPVSAEAPSEQTGHSVEKRVDRKHLFIPVLFGPVSHRKQH